MPDPTETPSAFRTLKGYQILHADEITESMEDYLEMICRHVRENGYIRVSFLAEQLNVRPPSVSKMVGKLRELGLVRYEKYGLITMTGRGYDMGNYLLWRHEVLHRFFCLLNHADSQLELVEMVEHFMDRQTVERLDILTRHMQNSHW